MTKVKSKKAIILKRNKYLKEAFGLEYDQANTIKRGAIVELDDAVAKRLKQAGFVEIVGVLNPPKAPTKKAPKEVVTESNPEFDKLLKEIKDDDDKVVNKYKQNKKEEDK